MAITARQRRVLDYIKHYFDVHQEAPTIAEIGQEFGMSSSASVHHVVSLLEREGFIRRIPNVSRGIELVKDEPAQEHYEIPLLGVVAAGVDRKSTRLNSSHQIISYAVFCLKKKN